MESIEKVATIIPPITFSDIKDRGWALKTPVAMELLSYLPQEISEKLKKGFLITGVESPESRDVHKYFLTQSAISKIVTYHPSSAKTFEYLYHKKPVDNPVDEYFIRSKAGIGIYERLRALKNKLPIIIRNEISKNDFGPTKKFTIFNVGSGPGHDIIETLQGNPDLAEKIHVFCIDPDEKMLAIGEKKVIELNLSESFTFVPKKFEDTQIGRAHMILLIGILCPMSKKACIKILKGMTHFVYPNPNSIIIFNTVQKKMLEEDPLTDYIMRFGGWGMDYKENDEPSEIAKKAGWNPIDSFFDPEGYNCMVVARHGS